MQAKFEKVVMMGLGYIGLPTAAVIAKNKIQVLGVDVVQTVVQTVNRGQIHIVEPELDGLVKGVVEKKYLEAALQPTSADVFLVAVPTPFVGDHIPDITYVEHATQSIIPHLKEGDLFIIESTSPVGTTEKMAQLIFQERPELQSKIHIAYCPERVLPGNVIYELEHNDRVIGGITAESTALAQAFYRKFVKGELHATNARTAEMVKLTENSSRDVQIAFANELSMICDKADINVWELIELANKHPRVNILQPGTGVGGHCIAVDPWFIVNEFREEARLIRSAREINNYKSDWVIEKIFEAIDNYKKAAQRFPKVALMGLAFKPNIDDLRESPALFVAKAAMTKYTDNCIVTEPNIETHTNFILTDTTDAVEQADIVVFLVAHREFMDLPISDNKIVLDFCGVKK